MTDRENFVTHWEPQYQTPSGDWVPISPGAVLTDRNIAVQVGKAHRQRYPGEKTRLIYRLVGPDHIDHEDQ